MQEKQNTPQLLPLSISTFWKIIKSGALYNAYYEKLRLHGKPITLIGVNFDSQKRQIEEWKHE